MDIKANNLLPIPHHKYIPKSPKDGDLHSIVKEGFYSTVIRKSQKGINLPFHIHREFHRYLSCGILDHGFVRLCCTSCNNEKLVPFSCKGRTLCPSCGGRKMADTAKHLVEEVIPNVPVRQWVLTLPYKHRFLLAYDSKLNTSILNIVIRAISGFYKRNSKVKNAKTGSVTVIQRFGSALNLNTHFHILFMDGVYNEYNRFLEVRPETEDVKNLLTTIQKRIGRHLIRQGIIDEESNDSSNDLFSINSLSIQNLVEEEGRVRKAKEINKLYDPPFKPFEGTRSAYLDGFSLHANTKVLKQHRAHLEKLCRYVARPAISQKRVSKTLDGRVRLELKTSYTNGTTHLEFTKEQFIERIISLIPPPRMNLIRYHGVFGANHRNRKAITLMASPKKLKTKKKVYRTPWNELLKRVFLVDVTHCDRCGETLKHVSTIKDPRVCQKILKHLDLEQGYQEFEEARAPPMLFENSSSDFDMEIVQSW